MSLQGIRNNGAKRNRLGIPDCHKESKGKHMKFYEETECEHGWTDEKGFAHCSLGSGCGNAMESYCTKDDCPINEEEHDCTRCGCTMSIRDGDDATKVCDRCAQEMVEQFDLDPESLDGYTMAEIMKSSENLASDPVAREEAEKDIRSRLPEGTSFWIDNLGIGHLSTGLHVTSMNISVNK
jgi:hypothetical protein